MSDNYKVCPKCGNKTFDPETNSCYMCDLNAEFMEDSDEDINAEDTTIDKECKQIEQDFKDALLNAVSEICEGVHVDEDGNICIPMSSLPKRNK